MALVLNGSGTITGLTSGGLPDGSITSDDLASSVAMGKVLQVLQTTDSTITTTTSTAWVDSGLSVSITPSSSSSEILLMLQGGGHHNGSDMYSMYITLYRDATNIGDSSAGMSRSYDRFHQTIPHSIVYLDSPSTTSQVVYKAYFKSSSSSATVTFGHSDNGVVTLTAMEIAG